MPIADTPAAHVVVDAVAEYVTGELTVAPAAGLLTVTPVEVGGGCVPPPLPTVIFTVVYEAPPHLSHSSTTVCSAPAAMASDVLSAAPFTVYFKVLLT